MMRSAMLFLMVTMCGGPALAEDWPRFRGPSGQGISTETGLPTQWSATENVAWKVAIPGQGWSSPIVYGDRVFVTTATDGGVSCRVISIDRGSGKILWNKEVFQQQTKRKEGRNSYATPTPITDGKLVYAAFGGGSIAAVDFDGNVVWTNREIQFYSQHGLGASPILHGELLIMPYDGSNEVGDKLVGWKKPWDRAVILGIDKASGKTKWRAKRGLSRIAHVTPAILKQGDKVQLISGAGDVIQGHDPATGERIWSVYAQGEGVVPSIVLGEGLVYAASGFEKSTIRAVRPDGKGDVTKTHVVWEQTENVPTEASFAYANKCLFSVKENGMAMCLDGETGKILWKERLGGNYCASPVVAEGRVYFLSGSGECTIVEAGPVFKVVGKSSIGEGCQASMAVSGGQIFIRGEKTLFCVGKK